MNLINKERFDLDRTVRLVINCVLAAGAIWLINTLKGVLLPFLVGCLIAYILEPFLQYNRRLLHLKGRVAATMVTLFELTFFTSAVLYFTIPVVIEEASDMAAMIKRYAASGDPIPFLPEGFEEFVRRNIDFELIASKLSHEEWSRMAEEALSASWSVITGSISLLFAVFSWMIVLLYVIFVMIDYDKLSRGMRRMILPRYRKTVFKIAGDVKRSMNQYFRGQALVAFCVGILFSIGFLIIDLPLAIVLGMFIGLLNMVPYLQLISFIPTTLICLVYSVGSGIGFWTIWWECFAVYCIVQVIQDLYLTPRIIGKAMSLNPALIFLSLSIWGSLMGFIGLIIAIPLTT
ncbi:MAG: AI-2E family transporter, partial [Duncaniella sp.]|nr:AI-2E family transporter [Duncaniella sp.]